MRLFVTRLTTWFAAFFIFGALGFSALPSAHADESKSFAGDAGESKPD
jgi:preprotein translocase subunit SecG